MKNKAGIRGLSLMSWVEAVHSQRLFAFSKILSHLFAFKDHVPVEDLLES